MGDAEPEMACSCNEEMDFGVVANALEFDIVNIELEWNVAVDGTIGAEGVKAVEGDEEHGEDTPCSYATVRLGRWADHAFVLNSAGAPVTLDGESEERHGEMVGVASL